LLACSSLSTSITGETDSSLASLTAITQEETTGSTATTCRCRQPKATLPAITNPTGIPTAAASDGVSTIAKNHSSIAAINGCGCAIGTISEQETTRRRVQITNPSLARQLELLTLIQSSQVQIN
jgi:hypothetical protein